MFPNTYILFLDHLKLINNLNSNKATQQYDVPIKALKENSEIFS